MLSKCVKIGVITEKICLEKPKTKKKKKWEAGRLRNLSSDKGNKRRHEVISVILLKILYLCKMLRYLSTPAFGQITIIDINETLKDNRM